MYMSVLKADFATLQNREYLMDFDSGDFMHKWLTSQFDKSRCEENILYRIDKMKDAVYLYVQSDDALPEKNIARAGMRLVKQFPVEKPGQTVCFKIFCHPTVVKNGKRVFCMDAEKRMEWLKKRLSSYLSDIRLKEMRVEQTSIKGGVRISGVDFIGTANVVDADGLKNLASKGVGKLRNYGMGLLLYQ